MATILLILFILDGEANTFAVQPNEGVTCEELLVKVPEILPKLIGRTPQAYAAACTEIKLLETKI